MILHPHLCTVRFDTLFKENRKPFSYIRYGTLLQKVGCEVGKYLDLDVGSGIRNETVQKGYKCKKIESWECTFLTWEHGGTRRPGQQQN
jgi:hypothetical protein